MLSICFADPEAFSMSVITACIMHPPVISSSVTRGSTLFPQRLKTPNDLHDDFGSRSNDIPVKVFSKKHPREFLSTQRHV